MTEEQEAKRGRVRVSSSVRILLLSLSRDKIRKREVLTFIVPA